MYFKGTSVPEQKMISFGKTRLSFMFVRGPEYRIIEGPGCFTKSRKEPYKRWVIYRYWLSSYPMKWCQIQRCLSPAVMFLYRVLLSFIRETMMVPVNYDVLKVLKTFLKWINSIKYWQGCGLTRTYIYCFTVTLENYLAVTQPAGSRADWETAGGGYSI